MKLRYIACWVLALLVGSLCRAEASKVVDLDFSRLQAGAVPDRLAPEQPPAVVPTYSVFGRLRGKSAIPQVGTRYASVTLGRTGELDALRLGNAGDGLSGFNYRFEAGTPFSLELWMYVYNAETYFTGVILRTPPGPVHGRGISLVFQRAKWSKEGWLEWRWGMGTGSDGFWHHGFSVEQWHQVVITSDGTMLALYVDGELSDSREQPLLFADDGQLVLSSRDSSRRQSGLDYKLDGFCIYNESLTADEVAGHYAAGKPTQQIPAELEAQLSAMKLAIPRESCGYFRVGEAIPVLIDSASPAESLTVNGQTYVLPLTEPVKVSFAEPGFQTIHLALAAHDRLLKQVTYPIAIMSAGCESSRVGAAEMASRQPEVRALGMKLDRVVVAWRELEPVKGEYDWTRLDAVMERSRELGAETILCFTGMPRWMDVADGSLNLPVDMSRYTKLWKLLVNRYDGLMACEVWNASSPNNALAGDTAQRLHDYLILLRAAATAIRGERPDAIILAGRIDLSDGRATAAYLQKHASDLFDIFSVRAFTRDPSQAEERMAWCAQLRAATTKPVWNTANGLQQLSRVTLLPPDNLAATTRIEPRWPSSAVDGWTGAAWQIQDIANQLAGGIERIILEYGPGEYVPDNNATTGLPGVKGLALAVFNGLTGGEGATFSRRPAPAGVTAISFVRPGGSRGLIVFSSGPPIEVELDADAPDAQLYDLIGRRLPLADTITVSTQPVYLLNRDLTTPEAGTENQP